MSVLPTDRAPSRVPGLRMRLQRRLAVRLSGGLALALWAALFAFDVSATAGPARAVPGRAGHARVDAGCVTCHAGIEAMHPEAELSCVDCHGGDGAALKKLEAHVPEPASRGDDERVAGLTEDLAWRRFRNPMDLRVAQRVCGDCHEDAVGHVLTSLHGTTAGHLSDGYYEMGLTEEKGSRYGVFPVTASTVPRPGVGALESLVQVPPFRSTAPEDELATHFTDLARKECMQCHLWSEGRAVRGRVGFDGDYRGDGCAACHVSYALDGLSRSADAAAQRREPGHPRAHAMTRAPATQTCTSCHYGDASIGLAFRGLSQLPPGAPGGPEVPGTTDTPLNRVYYLDDPALVPPDVHHERGMHCVDCHTQSDVMGDGALHGQMEYAVEISCEACHGDFDEPTRLVTERGTVLEHLRRVGERVVLTSKVDGREHTVPQVVHVLDPARPEYNSRAAEAMTGAHGAVECYACHASWNVNFLGFHFDRNESLTQLDLLSGRRTKGRVTTQEKVFATWKSFYAGKNEAGRIAPYMTGFSTMGSVRDENGETQLDQVLPVTAKGLSGLTMIHHQTHTVRPTARSCVECHRSSSTWGMGSPNFRLGRRLVFVADRRGIEVVAVDRALLGASVPLGKVVQPDVRALALECDPLQGHARVLWAAEGGRGVHAFDVSDPTAPLRLSFTATIDPTDLVVHGEHLYVADGEGGLRIFDVRDPRSPRQVGAVPMFRAHDLDLAWPYAYVADGPGGLVVVDVRAPIAPRIVGGLDLNRGSNVPNDARFVASLFQYSRPVTQDGRIADHRTPARMLVAVLDGEAGLVLVDATRASAPRILSPSRERRSGSPVRRGDVFRGLVLSSHVDVAEERGGEATRETDYAYVLVERPAGNGYRSRLEVMDVGDPVRPRRRGALAVGLATEMLAPVAWYSAPFLERILLIPGAEGLAAVDVTTSAEPKLDATFAFLDQSYVAVAEEFPLDRMVAVDGRPLKDVSHPTSRWLNRAEIERVLGVGDAELGLTLGGEGFEPPGRTARLFLAQHDADGSAALEGTEIGGFRGLDADGDGRIPLVELAGFTASLRDPRTRAEDDMGGAPGGMAPGAEGQAGFAARRTAEDGDLTRLLDGLSPYDFDRDGNDELDFGEVQRAFFAALDLDGDAGLSFDELSRHPGELRRLRHRDGSARDQFRSLDGNGSGRIAVREFRLRQVDFDALDVNRDGVVQLQEDVPAWWRRRGYAGPLSEWPTRRADPTGLPPGATLESVLAALDRNGDRVLGRPELKRRPGLMAELDRDGDELVSEEELQQRVDRVAQLGVRASADEFVERWDLDGDGKVETHELPAAGRRVVPVD